MRLPFLDLPGEDLLPRPVVPVVVEELTAAPQLCLVDTGSVHTRLPLWLAEAVGIDLTGAPTQRIALGGHHCVAGATRCTLTIAGNTYDAPVTFCDPWPFAFSGLLGQEDFLRFFRLELCVAEGWLELNRELGDSPPRPRG